MRIDISGQKFGRLTALKQLGHDKHGNSKWECLCDCGNTTTTVLTRLKTGHTQSCGCYRLDRVKEECTLPNNLGMVGQIYNRYRVAARKRNLEFSITLEEFQSLIYKPCVYCGVSNSNKTTKNGTSSIKYNGVDRVENVLGYNSKNCVTCCHTCNRAKRTMTVEEFLAWVKRVYNFSCKST